MLDTDTKRRIDTARDILVGKVPDPKSQVEQITIALIYKFMDDMDAESEELGGKRKFFTGDYARYGWAKLMAPSLGGHEMLGLYGEGISKMPENPGIPALFRDIFKNAYLPYRDPETLKAFLKIIDEFSYDHSERLGDAFEYPSLRLTEIGAIHIPLPPLEVQKEIVAEIEGYQKVINGARAVLDHYRPHIPIHPDWPIPTFEDAPFQIIDGDRGTNYPSKEDFSPSGHCLFLNTKNVRSDGFKFDELEFISAAKDNALRKGKLERGDVLLTTRGTIGNTALYDPSVEFDHIRINSGMLIFRPDAAKLSSSYLFHFFQSENFRAQREAIVSGAAQPQLPIRSLNEAKIPLPPLATQQAIVAEIEAEQALVGANRELITRFEKKIQATLARVWGEDQMAPVEGKGREERNAHLRDAPGPYAAPAGSGGTPLEKPVFP
ncbi:MAG: restriction endonuclease subunit S [Pseudomonadota bacterium]